jgi:hypothetical protein
VCRSQDTALTLESWYGHDVGISGLILSLGSKKRSGELKMSVV